MDAPSTSRRVIILGLDTFAKKNITQIRSLEDQGYAFTVITNDQRSDSEAIFDAQRFEASNIVLLQGNVIAKARTVWSLLRAEKLNHVELYAAGRMAILYLLMIRLTCQKLIVVERGDIDIMHLYGPLVRLAMRLAYRWADAVVYKETYMASRLAEYSDAPLVFVPNCVDGRSPDAIKPRGARTLDFLWVNRTIPQRRPEWVIAAAQNGVLAERSFAFLGIEKRDNLPGHLKRLQQRAEDMSEGRVTLMSFADPHHYYRSARFFCLPSTIVFGNNSLLEAMSWGVVPIVTEAPGVDLVVEDGVNGIVTAFDESAYQSGLLRAASLSEQEWRRMSANAIGKVRDQYSIAAWTQKMSVAYRKVGAS